MLSFALTACQQQEGAARPDDAASRPLKTPALVTDRPKIVAFGDSLTAGFGLTERESYPYLLQERLNALTDRAYALAEGRETLS